MKASYRRLAIALGVLIGLTLVSSTVMGGMMGTGGLISTGTMMPGMMGAAGAGMRAHMGGWIMGIGMGLMWLTMFAFWGALIVGIIILVKWLTDKGNTAVQ